MNSFINSLKSKWYLLLVVIVASAFQGYALYIGLGTFGNGLVLQILAILLSIGANLVFCKSYIEKSIKNEKKLTIFSILISLVALKSLFRTPLVLISGFLGIVVGIGLWFFLFVLIWVGLSYLNRARWYYKETKALFYRLFLYMIPGLVVSGFLWLCNWPGIMQADSAYMWEMTIKNHYINSHPLTYTMFIKLLRNIWDFQGFMVLIQIVFCAFVYGYVAYTFEKLGLKRFWCWVLAIVLAIIPTNAINSVTFLKDIPYNMSLVLMAVVLLDLVVHDRFKTSTIVILAIACIIALCSRHNSILTIPLSLGFTAFAYMLKKKWKVFWLLVGVTVVTVSVKFGLTKAIELHLTDKLHKIPSMAEALMLPTAQCAYTTSLHWEEFNDTQKEDFHWYYNVGYFNKTKKENPVWNYNYKYQTLVYRSHIGADWKRFVKFYLGLLKDYPGAMLREYEMITSIAWCAPNYGYTMARNYERPEWSGHLGIEFNPILPKTHEFIDNVLLRPREGWLMIFWRPALSLLLCFILSYLTVKRWGFKALAVISPAFFNALGYMVVNPAQCTRYLYSNFSIFFIFLVFTLMVNIKEENNNEEQKTLEV